MRIYFGIFYVLKNLNLEKEIMNWTAMLSHRIEKSVDKYIKNYYILLSNLN